jgi:predicted transcriptional regulator
MNKFNERFESAMADLNEDLLEEGNKISHVNVLVPNPHRIPDVQAGYKFSALKPFVTKIDSKKTGKGLELVFHLKKPLDEIRDERLIKDLINQLQMKANRDTKVTGYVYKHQSNRY